MLKRFINRLIGNRRASSEPSGIVVTHNIDSFTEDERQQFWQEASKVADVPVFQGSVEHGYAAGDVAGRERCPRCGGTAEKRYANFIYATQLALRVVFAPAGHFCTRCPSVIIEEGMIEAGIADKRFKYRGVIGIDYGGKRDSDYFRTWNGEELVYLLDEEGHFEGVVPHSQLQGRATYEPTHHSSPGCSVPQGSPAKKRSHKKNREKMASNSRKRNRK